MCLDDRRVITAAEAQRELGIPAGTIRSWATQKRLHPVSIDRNRERWYRLSDVLHLASSTRRRKPHIRPTRRPCPRVDRDIA